VRISQSQLRIPAFTGIEISKEPVDLKLIPANAGMTWTFEKLGFISTNY
jgi:hypothetical protein